MIVKNFSLVKGFLLLLALCPAIAAQGGVFELTEGVVAGSGGSTSDGNLQLDATAGQPIATGAISAEQFGLTTGFWNFTPLAPTEAQVSISGQVRTVDGIGISGAMLYLQTQTGDIYATRSASLGYYMFEGIMVGQSVFITVEHKRFTFEPRSVMLSDNVTDLDFLPQ